MTADELRNELGGLIWKTAINLVHGGKVSPVQFMDFMLGSLFYRFISEDVIDYCNNLMKEAGVPDPDYANMPDEKAENAREQIINAKGFFILPSHRAEGINEGIMLIAKNLKTMGLSVADIIKATGLSEDDIAKL